MEEGSLASYKGGAIMASGLEEHFITAEEYFNKGVEVISEKSLHWGKGRFIIYEAEWWIVVFSKAPTSKLLLIVIYIYNIIVNKEIYYIIKACCNTLI